MKDQLFEIGLESDLDLSTIPPDEIDVIIGEGGDTFSDSKDLKQNYKVFAVSFAIRVISRNGKEIWRDKNPQSDESRVPIAVINASENSDLLKKDLLPVVEIMEDLEKNTLDGIHISRKLEGDLKYKKLYLNRLGQHNFCDFCKVSLDNVQNLCHH